MDVVLFLDNGIFQCSSRIKRTCLWFDSNRT